MRTQSLLWCLLLTIATGCAQSARTNAWATDWSAFVKQVNVLNSDEGAFAHNANVAFGGKRVTWSGKVVQIKQPENADPSGLISITMNGGEVATKSGKVPFFDLSLRPEGKEWKTWSSVAVGDTVSFTTTLTKGDDYVLGFMTWRLEAGGFVTGVIVKTRGGSCLQIVAPAKKWLAQRRRGSHELDPSIIGDDQRGKRNGLELRRYAIVATSASQPRMRILRSSTTTSLPLTPIGAIRGIARRSTASMASSVAG